jgi:hypothetical protein
MNDMKTPITDVAEYELQEAYDGYDGLSSAPTKVVNPESMRALEIKYNETLSSLRKLESELLSLANGDKLLPEASNNTLIIEEYIRNLNDKIIFANDVLEEVKGAAHSKALLGGSPDEYLGALLKVGSLAGQGLAKLKKHE